MSTTAQPESESTHIDIDQLFVRTAAVSTSFLYASASLHSSGFMLRGREPTTVFPGSAGLSRDLAEIRNVRSRKICGTNSCDRAIVSRSEPPFRYKRILIFVHFYTRDASLRRLLLCQRFMSTVIIY